jgi:hypothetical protein
MQQKEEAAFCLCLAPSLLSSLSLSPFLSPSTRSLAALLIAHLFLIVLPHHGPERWNRGLNPLKP